MRDWISGQGVPDDLIRVLSDENGGRVVASDIFDAVKEIVDLATIEQLIVYFAGHGINSGYAEYWLLSDAPENPNQAVNVKGSEELARRCGIPHVVFISDACRTRPDSIGAQSVTGTIVFPSRPPTDDGAGVDLFFACRLGEAANEFANVDDSSSVYRSLYTEVLLEGLKGEHPSLMQAGSEGPREYQFVRPWPLKRGLPALVRDRITDEGLWTQFSQTPTAHVTSDPLEAWLARYAKEEDIVGVAPPMRRPEPVVPEPGLDAMLGAEVRRVVGEQFDDLSDIDPTGLETLEEGSLIASGARELSETFGPQHYESGAGFKFRGERVVAAYCARGDVEVLPGDDKVRVWGIGGDNRAASVLIQFASGACAVLPVLHEFMAAVTFHQDSLVDVAYEPMDTFVRWTDFEFRAEEIRRARSTLSMAARMGLSSFEEGTTYSMARYYQTLKGVDPSFALYAAYSYRSLRRRELTQEMREYQREDLGVALFDVDMLSGKGVEPALPDGRPSTVPFCPLLSPGWSLLPAYGIELHPALADPSERLQSLWTLFAPTAFENIRAAMESGELI